MQKKSYETVLFSTAGVVLMLGILIAVNIIGSAVPARIDLTQEKAYTLSAGTRAILKKLDTPITVRLYCTQPDTVTGDTVYLKDYARTVADLLAEYKQVAGRNLIIEKYDPQPNSDAEDSARLDGLEPRPVAGVDQFYLGLAVHLADQVQTIPFLAPNEERLLEYEITRAISRVQNPEKPTIGLMSALPVWGMPSNPTLARMGQQGSDPWTLVTELQQDYDVKRVELDAEKIDDDIKVLLVIYPKGISDRSQYAIDQFVLRGGKLVAFLDPLCVADNRQPSGPLGATGGSATLDKLLKTWGIEFDTTKVVADLQYAMKLRGRDNQPEIQPAWLGLGDDAINKNDVAANPIDSVWMPLCGAFTGTPAAGLKETVLLQSSKKSQLVEGFLANLSGASIVKDFSPSGANYKLAVRLTGKFKTAYPDGAPKDTADTNSPATPTSSASLKECQTDNTVVLFGDSDLLFDPFTIQKINSPFGTLLNPMNANLTLAQNLVEQLSGDSNLAAVRSRATLSRPFTVVNEMEARANEKFQSEIKRLEVSAAEAERKINELQAAKSDKAQRFVLSAEQQATLEKLKKDKLETGVRLRQVQKDLKKEVVSLQTRIKWLNILAVPVAVCAAGLAIALVKRKKTSAR